MLTPKEELEAELRDSFRSFYQKTGVIVLAAGIEWLSHKKMSSHENNCEIAKIKLEME